MAIGQVIGQASGYGQFGIAICSSEWIATTRKRQQEGVRTRDLKGLSIPGQNLTNEPVPCSRHIQARSHRWWGERSPTSRAPPYSCYIGQQGYDLHPSARNHTDQGKDRSPSRDRPEEKRE